MKIIQRRLVNGFQPDALLGLLHEHGLGGGVEAGVLLPVVRLSLRDVLQVPGGFDPLRAVHLQHN